MEKKLVWRGNSRKAYNAFSESAKDDAGYQLDLVQNGEEPTDWESMPTIGKGVCEIRVWEEDGTYRVIYVASIGPAVYVLHCLKKKTQKTPQADIDLAKDRYKKLVKELRS